MTRLTGFLGAAFERVDLAATGVLAAAASVSCARAMGFRLRPCTPLSRMLRPPPFSFSASSRSMATWTWVKMINYSRVGNEKLIFQFTQPFVDHVSALKNWTVFNLHGLLSEHHGEGGHQVQAPLGYRIQDALLLHQDLLALDPQEIATVTLSLKRDKSHVLTLRPTQGVA